MEANPFFIQPPEEKLLPMVVSSPHSGTLFPPSVKPLLKPEFVTRPPDTDWFIHELYEFAPKMGIHLIHARYSRYVIDLNRDPENKKIYADSRFQTKLVPDKSFAQENLYHSEPPTGAEISERREVYYAPYYKKIEALLHRLRVQFGSVLLFDAHSIQRNVPSIQRDPFPDLILGDREGTSADSRFSRVALSVLKKGGFSVGYNRPFRGGQITSYFGRPKEGIHALQLEMSQDVYMDSEQKSFNRSRASRIQDNLEELFQRLVSELRS